MMVYIDTSAIYAFMDASDARHDAAKDQWIGLVKSGAEIVCNSYVLLETYALVQHRLGVEASRALHEDVLPVLRVEWINEATHQEAATAMLVAGRRELSLVDCASFVTMRRLGIRKVFAFDEHFREQGFEPITL